MADNTLEPSLGESVDTPSNKWIVIAYKKLHEGSGGFAPRGVMLCMSTTNKVTPYVTWAWMYHDGELLRRAQGNYFHKFIVASLDYRKRGQLSDDD